ncbi:MAG: hypothetical protein ACFFCI_01370 [Promethearchaeota archaeon]
MKLNYKVLLLTILVIPSLFLIIDTNFKIPENSNAFTTENVKMASVVEWENNGKAVCTAIEFQFYPKVCNDGTGGAIITWIDSRGLDNDIYAQKVDSNGNMKWASNGIPICTANLIQDSPQIISDGSGGAIITWQDDRNMDYDIYAQRVDSNGNMKWATNGIPICTATSYQGSPQLISDGMGGAIITWHDNREIDTDTDIYAQRVDSNGNTLWFPNGTVICTAEDTQFVSKIMSDGASGAIITWSDMRTGSNSDIYIQRIDADGNVLWNPNGTAICTANYDQSNPQFCSDGTGGAIITWGDFRTNSNWDIYIQRIDSYGNILWDPNGTIICNLDSNQYHVRICNDQVGGAIITWFDDRDYYLVYSNLGVYAQRVDSNGNLMWASIGIPICNVWLGDAWAPEICSDGTGGAIIAWLDVRASITEWDIYVQRINSNGNPIWALNGTAVCTADENQDHPALCEDGTGGAFITWEDERSGTSKDIYVNMIKTEAESRISFGSYFITFTIISLFSLIIVIRRKSRVNTNL